ncbi:MAG: class I SAM-dependent methyltransferase [Solirubrobacteraceae bacterium]
MRYAGCLLDCGSMSRPRRLVFGEVADAYDRHRPAYPPELIDDVIAAAHAAADGTPAARALEIGAGTGKATAMLAARGVSVLALEPSAEMAAVARRNLSDATGVEIVESDFERFDPGAERFGLVYAAQSWHWIDPQRRYALARRALADDGILALFWNRPVWAQSELRSALRDVYRRVVPQLPADGPLHPANTTDSHEEDWIAEIDGVPEFTAPRQDNYAWHADYGTVEYVGLLGTLSETRLLAAPTREQLLDAVGETIEALGDGLLQMPMVTRLCLARPVSGSARDPERQGQGPRDPERQAPRDPERRRVAQPPPIRPTGRPAAGADGP